MKKRIHKCSLNLFVFPVLNSINLERRNSKETFREIEYRKSTGFATKSSNLRFCKFPFRDKNSDNSHKL